MSSLKEVDRIKLEKFLGMDSGYVSDFSDRTFRNFVLEVTEIDLYQAGYETGGTSKANRLRTFWKREPNNVVSKLTKKLLQYQRERKQNLYDGFSAEDGHLYKQCLEIIAKLNQMVTIDSSEDFSSKSDEDLEKIKEETAENAYVPSSIYHKAERELVRRHRKRVEDAAMIPKIKIGILNKGENNRFEGNTFEGFDVGIKDEGRNTLAKNNKFLKERKPSSNPTEIRWAKLDTIFGGLALVVMVIIWQFPSLKLFSGIYSSGLDSSPATATSTIPLSVLLSKAVTFDTVAERQDFLKKYKGALVTGNSTVTEVSRGGSSFIIDFNVNHQLITCVLPGDEANERRFLLMKSKKVSFVGEFSFINVYGHGLGLDNCDLKEI
jgi:hypothetical protein